MLIKRVGLDHVSITEVFTKSMTRSWVENENQVRPHKSNPSSEMRQKVSGILFIKLFCMALLTKFQLNKLQKQVVVLNMRPFGIESMTCTLNCSEQLIFEFHVRPDILSSHRKNVPWGMLSPSMLVITIR